MNFYSLRAKNLDNLLVLLLVFTGGGLLFVFNRNLMYYSFLGILFLSIDYCIINNTLLGQKIFKGINIFEENIEILIQKNNLKKLLKEEDFLRNNNIIIDNIDNKYLILKTYFFNNIEVLSYIFLFNEENNIINFYNNDEKIYNLNFYDIFPIKQEEYEEFNINVPNKIDDVLNKCDINLKFLNFKSDKMIVKNYFENNFNVCYIFIYIVFLIKNFYKFN